MVPFLFSVMEILSSVSCYLTLQYLHWKTPDGNLSLSVVDFAPYKNKMNNLSLHVHVLAMFIFN